MKNYTTRRTNKAEPERSPRSLTNICILFNSTYPQPDEYLAKAIAEARDGMSLDEFHDLADDVKFAVRRGETHPEADFVYRVQQRAFRIKWAAEGVEPPEARGK